MLSEYPKTTERAVTTAAFTYVEGDTNGDGWRISLSGWTG